MKVLELTRKDLHRDKIDKSINSITVLDFTCSIWDIRRAEKVVFKDNNLVKTLKDRYNKTRCKVRLTIISSKHIIKDDFSEEGFIFGDFMVGKPFRLINDEGGNMFSTSYIIEINGDSFKTINTEYKLTEIYN